MKLLNLYVFSILFSQVNTSLMPIKKLCKDCKYFIGDKKECRKFGVTDIITGEITYQSALDVRKDEKKCSEEAIHFEENNLKIITVPYYYLKDNFLLTIPLAYLSFNLYLVYLACTLCS
jgi:hypothetical protein